MGVAAGFDHAFTVEELAGALRANGPAVGLATVYRTVGMLTDAGWLEQVGERDGASLYFRCPTEGHHHHVLCTSCGRVETSPCAARGAIEAAQSAGFRVTRHEVTVYGLCPTCGREQHGR